jgi:hypothetical protein
MRLSLISIPNELVNHIFSYFEGSTNKIMKQHIKNICDLNKNENVNESVYSILQLNMDFGYIYFHYNEFMRDYI